MVQANVTASLVVAKPTVRKNIILPYFYQETQGKKKILYFLHARRSQGHV